MCICMGVKCLLIVNMKLGGKSKKSNFVFSNQSEIVKSPLGKQ